MPNTELETKRRHRKKESNWKTDKHILPLWIPEAGAPNIQRYSPWKQRLASQIKHCFLLMLGCDRDGNKWVCGILPQCKDASRQQSWCLKTSYTHKWQSLKQRNTWSRASGVLPQTKPIVRGSVFTLNNRACVGRIGGIKNISDV